MSQRLLQLSRFYRTLPVFERIIDFRYALLLILLLSFSTVKAQVISYPTAATSITRGYGSDILTVNIAFTSVCGSGNATVRIGLPSSVTYIPGSLTTTSSSGATIAIAEGSMADLRSPEFSITGIAAIGDNVTFTIRRKAGCSGAASGKDSIYVTATTPCSNTSEISSTNSYNILSPSISINAPATVSGVNVGDTLTLTSTVINGGNGCSDTVYFYTVYKAASLNVYETKIGSTTISPYATSGDTLFYKIAGSTLTADGLLCSGESFALTQKAIVKRCTDLNTYYGAGFGNGTGAMCGWTTGSTTINLDFTPPALTLLSESAGTAPSCAGDPWVFNAYFKNTGNSPLTNIRFNLGDEDGTGAIQGNIYFDTASLMIKTPVLASGALHHPASGIVQIRTVPGMGAACVAAGHSAAAFSYTFPAGTPPLMPGDSVAITYQANNCTATLNCGGDSKTFINSTRTRVAFTDQCGTNVGPYLAYDHFLYNPTGAGITEIRVPAMVLPGDCYSVTIVGGFNLGVVSPNNIEEVKIGLPSGTTYTPGSLSNLYGDAPLSGYPVQVGDTLIIRYNATTAPRERMFELKMNLCSSPTGPCGSGVKLFASSLIVVDSTCTNKIGMRSCLTKDINYICVGSGCPSGGAQMVGFSYARSSFGLPDNNNDGQPDASGTLDMTKIELDSYKPADIMKTKYVATVLSGSTVSSWNYMYSEWNFGKGPWRAYDSATIKIYKSGAVLYTLTGIPMTDVTGTGNQFFADWSTALATVAPGFSYSATTVDSVVVEGSFKFVPSFHTISATEVSVHSDDVPYHTTQDAQLSQSVFTTATGPGGTRSACGATALYNYKVYAMSAYSWGSFYPTTPTACNYASMMYRTHDVLGNSLPGRVFNYEYRANTYIDTLEFDIPAGWELSGTGSGVYWVADPKNGAITSSYGSALDPYTVITGSTATGRHVLINVKAAIDAGALSPLPVDAYFTSFVAYVRPTCSALFNTGAWSFKSHYLIYSAPDSQVHFSTTGLSNYGAYDSSVTFKANLSLQNNTGVVSTVQPQHYWDISVQNLNTSGYGTASNVWFALEDGSSPINIDSVVLKPSNVVLTPISYGSGNKIYQALTALAPSGIQDARIYFKTTSCAPASINFLAGWRCEGFPSVPEVSCLGTTRSMTLQAIPQPSEIQLSVARQPGNGSPIDLCTVDSTLLIVNSAQSANLIDPYLIIYPEAGLTLSTPIQVEYPLGSGDYQNATVTSVAGGGFKIDLTSHTAIGTNGILGTTLANPGYSPAGGDRQAKVKLNYTTDCSFTSGQPMRFYTYGNLPCGAPALGNGNIATTGAVNINGVLVSGSAGVTLSSSASAMSCGDIATFSLTAVPVSTATQAGDTVVYTLPAGVVYNGNFVRGTNCTACEITAAAGPAGTTIVKVKMETGVAASSTLAYSFDVVSAGGGCAPATVNAVYKRTLTTPLTCGGTPCPSSSAIIGNGSSSAITLNKPNLVISNVTVLDTPSWRQANYFANHVKVFYNNNGSLAYTGGVDTVEFFCNNSSTIPFAKQALTRSLAVGANDSDEYYIMMPIGSCSTGDVVTARIQTQTAAGTSQCLCSSSMFETLGVPLPLQFITTNSSVEDCAVQLSWTYNNASANLIAFEIERSNNARHYDKVGVLSALATSYLDITPTSGKWYYRIKAVATDEKSLYSRTLVAETRKCVENKVTVFPNPASETLNIVLQGASTDNSYELVNAMGQSILKGSLSSNANNKIDVSNVTSGTYIIKIRTNDNVVMQQINIVN